MKAIKPTYYKQKIHEMPNQMDGFFVPSGELKFFDVPYEDIHTWRNTASRDIDFKPFINTRFKIEKDKSRLCLVTGESWTYGGGIRDMYLVESPVSIARATHTTMGSVLAHITDSDLYQDAFPGDCTGNIVRKTINAVKQQKDQYDEVLVFVQFSDPVREYGYLHALEENDHIKQNILHHQETGETMNVITWLKFYERGYLKKLNEECNFDNVKICVWKNFSPWWLAKEELEVYENLITIDSCWTNFNSTLEGYPVDMQYFSNPGCLDTTDNQSFGRLFDKMSDQFVSDELERMERRQTYWEDISPNRISLNVFYPNRVSHQLWAMNIINQTGWYKEVI